MSDDSLIEDLREQIAQNRVLVIVGAGVSMGATGRAPVASWPGLLHDGIDRCVAVAGLDAARAKRWHEDIDSGHLDEMVTIAERIERLLGARNGGGEYRRWLRETVGRLTITDRSVLEALGDLGVPLATTNYDDLLTKVTGRRPLPWTEHALVQRVVRGDDDAILHLHGCWEQPSTVVLGVSSYRDVTDDKHAQTMQQIAASTRTLLFVGCGDGLSDPNFGAFRDWMAERFAGSEYRHYRLCLAADVAALRVAHRPEERILPLSYGAAHADLAPFLRGLRSAPASIAARTSGSAPAAPAPSLPPKPPRLYGRDAIVADLVGTLLSDPPPPTLVLGGPGMGKTTVTVAALHHADVAARFGARRVFVRLDSATTGAAILMEIAAALRLPPGPDPGARALTALAEAPALLVLDNAETPWETDRIGTEDVLAQFAATPGLALVASVRGTERPRGVGWRPSITIPALTAADSRRLFEAVSGRSFGDDTALAELLSLLDDVPLALDLMGHVAQSSEPADLLERWQAERAAMLVVGDGRTRLDSFAVSCELSIKGPRMTDEARRLLALLGLLPNGLARRNLDTLLPGTGARAAATLRAVGLAFDDGNRLRVRAPLREHVAARHPPEAASRDRLIAVYVALASEGGKLGFKGGAEAMARLIPEIGNIDAVLLLGLAGDYWRLAVAAACGFGGFVQLSGYGSLQPLERAEQATRTRGDRLLQAECLMRIADIALARSAYEEAQSRCEAALPLYRDVGSGLGEANCIKGLGDVALMQLDHEKARSRYEEALPLYRDVGDGLGEANCIKGLGDVALMRSDHEEALSQYETALIKYRGIGGGLGEGNCIVRLGNIAFSKSDRSGARMRFMEALLLYRKNDALYSIANTHWRLAYTADTDADRFTHVEAARAGYSSIGRDDLIAKLDAEFPPSD